MKTLNYWNVKEYKTEEDRKACEDAWNNEIELRVDEYGRVYNEGGQYIADVEYQESSEY